MCRVALGAGCPGTESRFFGLGLIFVLQQEQQETRCSQQIVLIQSARQQAVGHLSVSCGPPHRTFSPPFICCIAKSPLFVGPAKKLRESPFLLAATREPVTHSVVALVVMTFCHSAKHNSLTLWQEEIVWGGWGGVWTLTLSH